LKGTTNKSNPLVAKQKEPQIFEDPTSGRKYTTDPKTGASIWLNE